MGVPETVRMSVRVIVLIVCGIAVVMAAAVGTAVAGMMLMRLRTIMVCVRVAMLVGHDAIVS